MKLVSKKFNLTKNDVSALTSLSGDCLERTCALIEVLDLIDLWDDWGTMEGEYFRHAFEELNGKTYIEVAKEAGCDGIFELRGEIKRMFEE